MGGKELTAHTSGRGPGGMFTCVYCPSVLFLFIPSSLLQSFHRTLWRPPFHFPSSLFVFLSPFNDLFFFHPPISSSCPLPLIPFASILSFLPLTYLISSSFLYFLSPFIDPFCFHLSFLPLSYLISSSFLFFLSPSIDPLCFHYSCLLPLINFVSFLPTLLPDSYHSSFLLSLSSWILTDPSFSIPPSPFLSPLPLASILPSYLILPPLIFSATPPVLFLFFPLTSSFSTLV